MAKILITGGAGFIGSSLGKRLVKMGHEVLLLDNMSYGKLDNLTDENGEFFGQFVCMDIRDKRLFELMSGVDFVFHLAGIAPLPDCQADPCLAISVNVAGTANVLDAARFNGVKKLIFSSTSAIYEANESFPCAESDETAPYLIYSTSKKQAEMLVKSYEKCYGLNSVILRFFNVYGPHQDMKRKQPPFMGYAVKSALGGGGSLKNGDLSGDFGGGFKNGDLKGGEKVKFDESLRPTFFSNGEQKRDYIFVEDLLDLMVLAMEKDEMNGEILNAASGKAYSVKEIWSVIKRLTACEFEPKFEDASKFWDKYPNLKAGKLALKPEILEDEVNKFALGDNTKAKSFGWSPKVDLETGIKICVEYARKIL